MAYVSLEDWRPIDVDSLEPNAFEVVKSDTNKFVIAGPGAGKTELLAQRACYLLQTGICLNPKRILAISFKKDAARNLAERVKMRTSIQDASRFDSYTFDAFSKSILDRFYLALPEVWRPSLPYKIVNYTRRQWSEFLTGANIPNYIGHINTLQGRNWEEFYKHDLLGEKLPQDGLEVTDELSWASSKWWENSINTGGVSRLTFPMIGRLAELILRYNPQLLRVLQQTYQFVFLDEFQDTTHVQFDLVETAFASANSVLTAVGDHKQQIMRWAMALDDPFGLFQNKFNGTNVPLIRNYRSSPDLVRIQDAISAIVDPSPNETEAMQDTAVEGDVCSIFEFEDAAHEAEYLADLISEMIEEHDLNPRDFAILAKQLVADYVPELDRAFREVDLSVRDESQIQDLLTEPFTKLVLLSLRLAFGAESYQHLWAELSGLLAFLRGVDDDENGVNHLHESLDQFLDELKSSYLAIPDQKEEIDSLLSSIVGYFEEPSIKSAYPAYRHGEWFDELKENLSSHLFEYVTDSQSWDELLDSFEGKNSIPVMTIHKCKGLEFHTVFFLSLEDRSWWSFQRDPEEAQSAFFVAFSRAKQRIVFTTHRGDRRNLVGGLYEVLIDAGVSVRSIQR
ncbi:UvrD-helicase domain-containing protein [Maridesulfovibrio sp. FT414]|uniref:UvrD-helicase domain-containing protein n=1 Tax=Maridesulfovibrio sp. FT414 TaxID=2979469 RepID=UPI003D804A8C